MEDLERMVPRQKVITVGGRSVALSPIRVRHLPAVMTHLPGLGPFMEVLDGSLHGKEGDEGEDVDDLSSLLLAVASCAEDLVHIVAAASDLPVEWVMDLDPLDFIRLGRSIMEVNADFFAGALLAMGGREAKASPSPGAPSSSG